MPTKTSRSSGSQMLMIAYEMDAEFAMNPLLKEAQSVSKFRGLNRAFDKVFDDKRVILAMMNDLAPADSESAWNGRPSVPLMVTGRLAIMAPQRATFKRLMGWSYRTLEEEVKTNVGWRWVSGLYGEAAPRFQTIQTREAMLTPTTLALINRQIVNCAVELELTSGEQLRMDSSATDSDIHYPTDSGLLDDSARVLSRTFKRARKVVRPESPEEKAWFRDRHRQAHRLAWKIAKQARKVAVGGHAPSKAARPVMAPRRATCGRSRGHLGAGHLREAKTLKTSPKAYTDLLKIVGLLIEQAQQVQERLRKLKSYAAQKLSAVLEHYVPLVQQVVWQTRQRIIHKLNVEASNKLLSLSS